MRLRDKSIGWELRRFRALFRPNDCQTRFYQSLLERSPKGTILDIGSNNGSKAEIFRNLTDFVVAVEPDPDLANLLRSRFRFRKVRVLESAIGAFNGKLELLRFPGHEAYNTAVQVWADSVEAAKHLPKPVKCTVAVCDLQTLIDRYGPVKYVKIDIEGWEWEAISTLTTRVPFVSMEFNLPDFQSGLERSLKHLGAMGYLFNVAIAEPPAALEWAEWLPAYEAIETIVRSGWRYSEVFAKSDVPPVTSSIFNESFPVV